MIATDDKMLQSKELPETIKKQLTTQDFTQSDASKNLNSSLDLKTGNTSLLMFVGVVV